MGVATCYINIFIASILDHACTAFFIHTLYTDVVLYAQQKTINRDVELLAKNPARRIQGNDVIRCHLCGSDFVRVYRNLKVKVGIIHSVPLTAVLYSVYIHYCCVVSLYSIAVWLQGFDGRAGAPGPDGEIGMQGDSGPMGDPGVTGRQGDPGVPGIPGRNGDPGDMGEKGDMGYPGKKGQMGMKGEKSEPGEPGEGETNGSCVL